MRAIVAYRLGGPEVLELCELPRPVPGDGQVLVEMRAIGVNFAETERRRGVYETPQLPWVPGGEGAGVVVEVGPATEPQWLGRRVAFWAPPRRVSGAYGELCAVAASDLFVLPEAIDFELGAALPLQGLTAHGLAHRAADPPAGAVALVHAGAGGIGQILIQLLRHRGVRVLATTSSPEKDRAVAALGAEPLRYGDDLPARIAAATRGRGVDLVFDSIGRATQETSLAALAPYGRLIHYGEASGAPEPIAPDRLYDRCLQISAFGLDLDRDPAALARARRDLLTWLEDGTLRLTISRRLPLAEAAEAHRLLEGRGSIGKLLLLL